ncbi:cAMP-dependent protein kinase inhibitor beta [Prionailurus bengalensis]|uniref:cAMP-dependent protein kinase inhibitor beta n=1 Tax=Prionailurus bengalensis TaxID=37029 RepID=UPI001CA87E8C|nr:cAMP-dependent protein kinase inhibitor beta [Prionailurus bengalensis]XP_043448168.1 cAMP-dependent protein kinase inhibitor beta [Prionailurus bengalensis]
MMDVHLDTPEGQENASNNGKGSSGTGNQQDVAMRTDSSKMTDVEPVVNNFASSARTGRRNAVPDIQGSAGTGGISELPLRLEALSMEEDVKRKMKKQHNANWKSPQKKKNEGS